MTYQQARATRRSGRTLVGRFRGGKLIPVCAEPILGSESGMISQEGVIELEPIAGRIITPITAELISVFVPVQAMDAILDPDADYAGSADVVRHKLKTGAPLFSLENEGEISKRCGVNPVAIGATDKKVNTMTRLAHNCAVNFLRQRKYVKATLLLHSNTAITPAILSMTVLDRLNAVLDPEDRVNGMVNFETGTITAPVHAGGRLPFEGVFVNDATNSLALDNVADGTTNATANAAGLSVKRPSASTAPNPQPGATLPALTANLSGLNVGSVSLQDFYKAEQMDRIMRNLRQIVDANPQYGEEQVLDYVHGLSMDTGKTPFVIWEGRRVFGKELIPATDTTGVQDDVMRTDSMVSLQFSVPVPKTELGGIIITFLSVLPDETLQSQPHPILAHPWGAINFAADELKLDPVPVTVRDLDSDAASGDQATIAAYVGNHGLKRLYVSYGLTRNTDPNDLDNKNAVWQVEVPYSVTPETILYPADLDHYPFILNAPGDDAATYTFTSSLILKTPLIFGPTPVEELATVETEDVFDEE